MTFAFLCRWVPVHSKILAPVVLEHPDADESWGKDLQVLVGGARVEKLKVPMSQLKGLNADMLNMWGYKRLDLLKVRNHCRHEQGHSVAVTRKHGWRSPLTLNAVQCERPLGV